MKVNKSESIKNLAAALAKFQGEIQNPKNTADNPFFKSKYAPLNDVLNLVRPLLTKYGLSVLQSPSGDGTNIVISTMLLHESGEWIETDPLVLKSDKPTAQGAGSSITYARRYALSAVLGISSEDDDDANHASGNNSKPAAKNPPKPVDLPKTLADIPEVDISHIDIPPGTKAKELDLICSGCAAKINEAVKTYSVKTFKKPLCRDCQNQAKQGAK